MAPSRCVPWYSHLEWLDVYTALFLSNDVHKKKTALNRIAVWELRSSHVPVPVNVTRFLVEASLEDDMASRDATGNASAAKLQMLYGMAIVRFVNCYVDVEQKKVYAESIATISQRIGIPAEIVDCRHRITHQEGMPSLELLRHTAQLSIEYVASTYWRPQAALLREQLDSIAYAHQFALGLVAAVHDICTLQSLFPRSPKIKSSRNNRPGYKQTSIQEDLSVPQLLRLCAPLASLKKERERHRYLARVLKTTPEKVDRCPEVAEALSWCDRVRHTLPACLAFVDSLLHSFPHESLLLSFLKDWLLLAVDPTELSSAPLVCAVFWILGESSPNLTHRLVTRLIRHIVDPSGDQDPLCLPLLVSSNADIIDFQPSTSPIYSSQLHSEAASPSSLSDASPHTTGQVKHGGGTRSFALWRDLARTIQGHDVMMLVDPTDSYACASRLLAWLRCFLLTRCGDDSKELPPFSVALMLRICGSSCALDNDNLSCESPFGYPDIKDSFMHRLLRSIQATHARTRSTCSSTLGSVTEKLFRYYVLRQNARSSVHISGLLDTFSAVGINLPSHTMLHRFLQWTRHRRDASIRGNGSTSSVEGSPISLSQRPPRVESKTPEAVRQKFNLILKRFQRKEQLCRDTHSALAALREDARNDDGRNVRMISTFDHPWTHPGTLPLASVGHPDATLPVVVQLLPMSGDSEFNMITLEQVLSHREKVDSSDTPEGHKADRRRKRRTEACFTLNTNVETRRPLPTIRPSKRSRCTWS